MPVGKKNTEKAKIISEFKSFDNLGNKRTERATGTNFDDITLGFEFEPRASKFISKLLLYLPSQLLPAITAFLTTPLLTRILLPAEYGQWSLAINISSFFAAFAVSGFGSAILRFYPSYENKKQLNIFLSTLYISIGVILIAVSGLILVILVGLKSFMPSTLIQLTPIIFAIFISQSVFSIFLAMVRAQERSGLFTFFQLLTYYGSLGIGFYLVIARGFGIEGLLLGNFIAYIFSLPFLIVASVKGISFKFRDFQISDAMHIWEFSWPLIISNLAMWGLRVSDLFIINSFRPEQEVGIYSVSYNISSRSIELLVTLFLLSVSPFIFRTWENKGREATEKALTMVTRLYLILCLPAAVGLTALSFPFVQLLTTPDYYDGYRIIVYVVFSSFTWGLANIAMMGLTIKRQARRLATNTVIAALIHVGLQIIFVPSFGYIATAISTLIGFITLLILHTAKSRPYLTWHFPGKTYNRVICASVIMGLTASGIYQLFNKKGAVSIPFLLLSIIIGSFVYLCCLWLFGEISSEEKSKISRFFKHSRKDKHA